MHRDTEHADAHECYLEGERTLSTEDLAMLEKSVQCFKDAIKHDRKFARAHGYLAYAQAKLAVARLDGVRKGKLLEEAKRNADKAVKLDPDDYANLWDLGFVEMKLGRLDQSRKTFDRALELYRWSTPHIDCKPGLLVEMAESYLCNGEHMRAIELAEEALRKPDWYKWMLAMAHYCVKDYGKALEVLGTLYRQPGDPRYLIGIELLRAAIHVRLGEQQPREAEAGRTHAAQAQACMGRFRARVQDWSCARERARMKFRRKEDGDHWIGALRKAGLP